MKSDSMSNDQTPEVGAMLLEDTQSVINFFYQIETQVYSDKDKNDSKN